MRTTNPCANVLLLHKRSDDLNAVKFMIEKSPYCFALVDGALEMNSVFRDISTCHAFGIPLICIDDYGIKHTFKNATDAFFELYKDEYNFYTRNGTYMEAYLIRKEFDDSNIE